MTSNACLQLAGSAVLCFVSTAVCAESVTSILVDGARKREVAAATELSEYLARRYPSARFTVGPAGDDTTHVIAVGTKASQAALVSATLAGKLATPGSFVVFRRRLAGKPAGCVLGADLQGLRHGMYALLERLGYGFYLSSDTEPDGPGGAFSFDAWRLEDQPLVPLRLVFNWHNFLSGCSTWRLRDWQSWIGQSQKMGYNAVMVHAYGNNPMAGFTFKGKQKPVGYLSSTRVGRDWSTNHVNDVRNLWGGDVFDGPVFGCEAAIEGSHAERTKAAQRLMAGAFAHAEERGVDVYFAVDVDTISANPQELIRLLPERARFQCAVKAMSWMGQNEGAMWLPDPDTAEGYAYYEAQVEELLTVYPQIDCLVVWHRKGSTPWMGFAQEHMPRAWQQEYREELRKTPEAEKLWHALHMFAQAKIVRAFQRAARELGRSDVRLAFGSWDFLFLPAAHRFMPPGVALLPLDWMVLKDQSVFDVAAKRELVRSVAGTRPVVPIAWAHHDDGNYVGRPYTPMADFYDRLTAMRCENAGFGIIHWTTRPLDLYFKSLANQVWRRSRNEPIAVTCRRMAADYLGTGSDGTFGQYLLRWVTEMPKIGRETSDFFIDHKLKDLSQVEHGHEERMKMLAAVAARQHSAVAQERLAYFRGLEDYILDVYRTEDAFNRARQGRPEEAREALGSAKPESVIQRYAQFSKLGGITRGEQGLVVSMNTRWLPHYTRLRQQLGVEPVRLNFGPTSHDLLAQSRGVFTFHFTRNHLLWQTLGTAESGCPTFKADVLGQIRRADIFEKGIVCTKPTTLLLAPILKRGSRGKLGPASLPAGRFRLTLLLRTTPEESTFAVDLTHGSAKERHIVQLPPRDWRTAEKELPLTLQKPGTVRMTLTPQQGKVHLSGLTVARY